MKITVRFVYGFLFSLWALLPFAQAGEPAAPRDSEPKTDSKALTFPISYTGEGLGNLSGGYRQGAVYDAALNAGVQGDLEKLMGWKGGSFLVNGLYPHGASLTEKYVHDFNAASSIDAYDTLRLYEAWVQQEFADGKFSLRAGQLLADSEFFVSNHAALFVNGAFGAIPLVSQNFSAPVYPVAAPGIRAHWTASEAFAVQAGVYDGNAGDPAKDNRHGVDWSLNGRDGALVLAEIAYTPKETGGVYKLGAFYHTATEDEAFPNLGSRATAGSYFIADQPIWREAGSGDQGLSAFLRIGGAPQERNVVSFYFDTGFNYKGLIPGRDHDVAGIGVSYTKLSPGLCDEMGDPVETHHEAILEATYRVHVTEWFTLQPDIQYIFNPGATAKADNALVAGLRFVLTF